MFGYRLETWRNAFGSALLMTAQRMAFSGRCLHGFLRVGPAAYSRIKLRSDSRFGPSELVRDPATSRREFSSPGSVGMGYVVSSWLGASRDPTMIGP